MLRKFVLWVLYSCTLAVLERLMAVRPGLAQVWQKTVCPFPDFFYGSLETPPCVYNQARQGAK